MINRLDPSHLPGVRAVAAASLDLGEDAAETGAIIDRLLNAPRGRRTAGFVAVDGGAVRGVVLASGRDREPEIGHLDLVAVDPAARGKGVARTLVTAAEEALAAQGVRTVRIAGNDPCYAWPGIDVRYTPAICAALALGYRQIRTGWNMTVQLDTVADTSAAEDRLAAAGIVVRKAESADIAAIGAMADAHYGGGWAWESAQAIIRAEAGLVAGCHLALREGEVLGFAAFGALRPSLFGPMATLPTAQGTGIGGVLLRRCLADQRAAGLETAQIGWAGPVAFYARAVGARIERVFAMYEKTLP